MTFLGMILAATLSFGQLFVQEGIGQELMSSPGVLALSGAKMPGALLPGFLGAGKKAICYRFSFNLSSHTEKRGVLAYDQFDNTVGEATIYSKAWNYSNIGFTAIGYKMGGKGLAMGFYPRYDLTYDYDRIERSDAYTVLREKHDKNRGKIYETFLSFGSRIKGSFYGGIRLSYLMGSLREEYYYMALPDTEQQYTHNYDMSGFTASLNLLYKREYLASSFLFSLPAKLKGDLERMYPLEMAAHFCLKPPAKLPTAIFFSYTYAAWGSIDTAYTGGEEYHDSHRFSLAFQHLLLDRTPLRVGASITKSYVRQDFWYPSFSFGIGYILRNGMKLEFGTSFTPLNYYLYDGDTRYNVRESVINMSFGISGMI